MKIQQPGFWAILVAICLHSATGIGQNNQPQKVTISGSFVNPDNKPYSFLSLLLIRTQDSAIVKGAITNEAGEFTLITVVENKPYSLVISEKNQRKFVRQLNFTFNDTIINMGKIRLEETVKTLEEVNVRGRKPLLVRKIDRLEFDVANSVLSAGYNALEILSRLPGVIVDYSGNVSINGKPDVYLLIDGKGQFMTREQAQTILSSLRAENIDKIEIITNPSAKYDARGSAIIDVITKKEKMKSDVHGSYGSQLYPVKSINGFQYPFVNVGTNLNYGKNRFRTFLSADFNRDKQYRNAIKNVLTIPGKDLTRNYEMVETSKETTINIRTGFNYDEGKKSNFDVVYANYISASKKYKSRTNTSFSSTSNKETDSLYTITGGQDYGGGNISSLSAKYSLKLNDKGNNFFILADYTNYKNPGELFSNGVYDYPSGRPQKLDSFYFSRRYKVNIYSFNIDYEQPLGKTGFLETGLKTTAIYNNDLSGLNYEIIDGSSINELTDNTRFRYRENISGAYLNLRKSYKKLKAQTGIRGEYTYSKGVSSETVDQVKRTYFNLFPSGALLYNFKDNTQLGLTYSTRIVRPSYSFFNPATIYTNVFASTEGNLKLDPQILNNWEISFLYKGYYASVSLSHASDPKIDLPREQQNSGLPISRYVSNLKYTNNYTFNLNIPLRIKPWWQSYTNISLLNNMARLLDNTNISSWFTNLNLNHSITIDKKSKAEINFYYTSGTRFAYSKTLAIKNLSLGYRRSLIKDRFDLTFNMNDVLGINKFKLLNDYIYLFEEVESIKNSRSFRLSLVYQFNTGNKFFLRNNSSKGSFGEKRY